MGISKIQTESTHAFHEVDISHHKGQEEELKRLLDLAEETSKGYKFEALTTTIKLIGGVFGILGAVAGAALLGPAGSEMAQKVSQTLMSLSQTLGSASDVAGVYPKEKLARLQTEVSTARTYLDTLTQEMGQARQVNRATMEGFQRAKDLLHDALRAILEAARG